MYGGMKNKGIKSMILGAVFFAGLLASGCLGWAAAGYIPQEEVSTIEIGGYGPGGRDACGHLYGNGRRFSPGYADH